MLLGIGFVHQNGIRVPKVPKPLGFSAFEKHVGGKAHRPCEFTFTSTNTKLQANPFVLPFERVSRPLSARRRKTKNADTAGFKSDAYEHRAHEVEHHRTSLRREARVAVDTLSTPWVWTGASSST